VSEPKGEAKRDARQTVVGRVVSAKMKDTIVVVVERLVKHATYGKYVRRKSRYAAHDAGNTAKEGDEVEIMQTRPISKTKNWRLVGIVRRSHGGVLHADVDVAAVVSKGADRAVEGSAAKAEAKS
jgi:small subunit ribosomal protein S17